MASPWGTRLTGQLDQHWHDALRPRLVGLTDEEYQWEPVEGCWNVRPRGTSPAPVAAGGGPFTIDFAFPEPDPAPVTTIAWRLGHLVVGIFGARAAAHFGGPPCDYQTHHYPGDARTALTQLDEGYAAWTDGVRGLSDADLERPVGPSEGDWSDQPMATLVLHVNREAVHHGAEIALLRDLYLRRS